MKSTRFVVGNDLFSFTTCLTAWLLFATPLVGVCQKLPARTATVAVRNPALRAEILHRMDVDQEVRRKFLEWAQQKHQGDTAALKGSDTAVPRAMRAIDRDNTSR